jgi:hypothetical protein
VASSIFLRIEACVSRPDVASQRDAFPPEFPGASEPGDVPRGLPPSHGRPLFVDFI